MMNDIPRPVVIIIGGGLVGSLNAIFFAKTKKYDVILLERNDDIRNNKVKVLKRSINITISHRAVSALKEAGIEDDIMKLTMPMFARMIHEKDGSLTKINYGKSNESIMAIDRMYLNQLLYNHVEKYENITMKFHHKLVSVNLLNKTILLSFNNEQIEMSYDLLVGNDGAHSIVRQEMMKYTRINYSQEYIAHGYKELYFPPGINKEFQMDKYCLHLWPRSEFMLMAQPNSDGSFTGSLFMPYEIFDSLKNPDDLEIFFKENFPDALNLMGKNHLSEAYFAFQPSEMITVRCHPYNYKDSCILMGDAAHAMVPFYGQGMNSGFEDIIIFHELLRENNYKFDGCCSKFTERRNRDANAMCDLSFFNYIELRKLVNPKFYLIRKKIDNLMNTLFPSFWIPLYSMVTFTRIPYTKCVQERRKQDTILKIMSLLLIVLIGSALYLGS